MRGHNGSTVDLVRRAISAEITRRWNAARVAGFGDGYGAALLDLQGWLDGAEVNELLAPPPLTMAEGFARDAAAAARVKR